MAEMSICESTLGFLLFFGHMDRHRLCIHCTHSTHYSLFTSFTLRHEHPFLGLPLDTTNAVSSTFDFKGVICTVLPSLSTLPLPLSLSVFFFLLHGSSGSSVHYVLGKQPGQRARGGGAGEDAAVCQDMKTVSARTCHCPPLTCLIQLACNGQKRERRDEAGKRGENEKKLHVIIKENARLNFSAHL